MLFFLYSSSRQDAHELLQATVCLYLAHVEVSVRIRPDSVRASQEFSRQIYPFPAAPFGQTLSFQIEDAHPLVQLRYLDDIVGVDKDSIRVVQSRPLQQVLPLRVEELDAVIGPIGHQHPLVPVHPHAVG